MRGIAIYKRLFLALLNTNSLRNKFELLTQQISGSVNIFMLSVTKLYSSFPNGQFLIPGYGTPCRIDRNCQREGIMLFVRDDIPYKLLAMENSPIEGSTLSQICEKKWLLYGSYNQQTL